MSNFGVYFQIFKKSREHETANTLKQAVYFAGDINGVGSVLAVYSNLRISGGAAETQDEVPACLSINLDEPSPKWVKCM